MENCVFCGNWDRDNINEDKQARCILEENVLTTALQSCPGFVPMEIGVKPERIQALLRLGDKSGDSSSGRTVKETIDREEEYDLDNIRLFEHQKVAVEKFKDKDAIALFFEMGCGKTVTCMTIAARKFKAGVIDSMLVVAPNDVHKQWYNDLCGDTPMSRYLQNEERLKYSVQIVGGRGGQKELYPFDYDDKGTLNIVCVNIDTFSQPTKWKVVAEWAVAHNTMLVVDEATVIKNPSSKRSLRMLYSFNDNVWGRNKNFPAITSKKRNTKVRAVLTGTPVTNGPVDLWAIMEFLQPNYFDRNYYSFSNYFGMHTQLVVEDSRGKERTIQVSLSEKTWWGIKRCENFLEAANMFGCSEDTYLTVKGQDKYTGPYKHADELRGLLEPVSVFVKLTDCVDMPKTHYIERQVGMSEAQTGTYNSMKRQLFAQYDNHTATAKNKLVVAIRLQQISSGFIVGRSEDDKDDGLPFWFSDEEYDVTPDEVVWLGESNPKLDALLRDVDELEKPIIIMTRFSAEAAKIYDLLKDKYNCCLVTGWKTVGSIEGFKEGRHDIMVANIAKISRGHNLQVCHTTLYYSNTFSMEHRQQSEFRTFRIGQSHPCTYIDYLSCDVDRTIRDSLCMKKNLLEYIREKDLEEIV